MRIGELLNPRTGTTPQGHFRDTFHEPTCFSGQGTWPTTSAHSSPSVTPKRNSNLDSAYGGIDTPRANSWVDLEFPVTPIRDYVYSPYNSPNEWGCMQPLSYFSGFAYTAPGAGSRLYPFRPAYPPLATPTRRLRRYAGYTSPRARKVRDFWRVAPSPPNVYGTDVDDIFGSTDYIEYEEDGVVTYPYEWPGWIRVPRPVGKVRAEQSAPCYLYDSPLATRGTAGNYESPSAGRTIAASWTPGGHPRFTPINTAAIRRVESFQDPMELDEEEEEEEDLWSTASECMGENCDDEDGDSEVQVTRLERKLSSSPMSISSPASSNIHSTKEEHPVGGIRHYVHDYSRPETSRYYNYEGDLGVTMDFEEGD